MTWRYGWVARWRYNASSGVLQKISITGYRYKASVAVGLGRVSLAVREYKDVATSSVDSCDCDSSRASEDCICLSDCDCSDCATTTTGTTTTEGTTDCDDTDECDCEDCEDTEDDSDERIVFQYGDSYGFYDPTDGEWGSCECEEYRTYGYSDYLRGLCTEKAEKEVSELLRALETDDETDDDGECCDEDDEEDEDDTEEDEDDTEEDDDSDDIDSDFIPEDERNRFRLFMTKNGFESHRGICVGLVLYWLTERLTTRLTLEQSDPDYRESAQLQMMYYRSSVADVARKQGLESVETLWVALDDALNRLFKQDGAFIMSFQPEGYRVGHAVGVFIDEDEVGYFDPNHGVFRVPNVEYCKTLMRKHIYDSYPDATRMRQIHLVRLSVAH